MAVAVGRVVLAAAGHAGLLWARGPPLGSSVGQQSWQPDGSEWGSHYLRVLPTRAEQLQKLRTTLEFDILVLGGGAIACGVALDAATRGLRVALCDIEAIEERQAIFASAPHLCHSVFVVMPLYDWRKALSVWFYFKTHWYIFSKPDLNENYWLSSTKVQELFPLLRKDRLVGAMVFREATIDDIRMNVALALTAARYGAVVVNHVGAKRFLKDKSGRLRGAVVKDTLTGEVWPVRAKCVVNATGSGADFFRQMDTRSARVIANPVLSTYMVLPWHFGHSTYAILTPNDKGTFISTPYQGQSHIAGSHKKLDFTQASKPTQEAVARLLKDWNEQLDMNTITPRLNEVLSTWTSVASVQESASGREKPVIEVSQSGLVTCTGGTWTWYRLLAERVVDAALASCDELQPVQPCCTRNIKVEGAENWSPTLFMQIMQKYRLEADVAKHLVDYYGDQAALLARMAANSRKGLRSLPGCRLLPRHSYIEAEVRHAVRHEYACTAVDVLARRLGVAYADANAAECMVPRIVEIMATELGWTTTQRERQIAQATRFLEENMGLSLCRPHRHAPVIKLNSSEFSRLVRLFQFLDQRQTGWVSLRRLRPHILAEKFRPEPWLRVMMRRLVDIAIADDSEAYLHNETYVPSLYKASVESGSTKGTELFTEKVEALSKALQLNTDSLSEILDEMEGATSGGMELGDFLLFMNNLKVCLRAQRMRVAKRDPNITDLVELSGKDIVTTAAPAGSYAA